MALATVDSFIDVMVDGNAAFALGLQDGPGLKFLKEWLKAKIMDQKDTIYIFPQCKEMTRIEKI